MANHDHLFQRLVPYIPSTLLKWYAEHSANEVHLVSQLQGTLICIDASGFTALTKELGKKGRGGSETLTLILNCFFEEMASAVFAHRGDILKFAGDALWAYFSDTFDAPRFMRLALDNLERSNATYPLTKERPLSIHAGAEFGSFSLASLGHSQRRLEIEPIGPLVDEVFHLCDLAQTNQLLAGIQLAESLSTGTTRLSSHRSYFEVKPADDISGSPHVENEDLVFRAQPIPQLEKYIPADVLARLHSSGNSSQLQSEHRQVVALFGYFQFNVRETRAISPDSITRLNSIMAKAFTMIHELNGSIARIDPYDHGHKLLILFGAPKKHEQDELHAIACAQSLLNLGNDEFRIRIGLAFGPLFCGDVGAERRREYTVMGDAANMAARLMSKAKWGKILLDDLLRSRLPTNVKSSVINLSLKGIGGHIQCYEVTGIETASEEQLEVSKLLGNEDELRGLMDIWRSTCKDALSIVSVYGEAGVGKSTLLNSLIESVEGNRAVKIDCKNSIFFGQGWLAGQILTKLYCNQRQVPSEDFAKYVESIIGSQWTPLFAEIFGIEIKDNVWTKGLSAELRANKACELYSNLIKEMVVSPQLIVIEEFDKADRYSHSLVFSLGGYSLTLPLMIVVESRNKCLIPNDLMNSITELRIQVLSSDEWWKYFREHFEGGKREHEFFDRLLKLASRNPQSVLDVVDRCLARKQLVPNKLTQKWELAESALDIKLPETLSEIYLSIFDNLQEIDREILKAAAVLGGQITAKRVSYVIHNLEEPKIQGRLELLSKSKVVFRDPQTHSFEYRHSSMREAIYSCIPEEQLVRLHFKYAQKLEPFYMFMNPKLLAYHFYNGESYAKAFTYHLKAAVESSRVHSLTEAASHFQRCKKIIGAIHQNELNLDDMFVYYKEYAKSLVLEGKYPHAYNIYRQWRRLGKSTSNSIESFKAWIETARVLWKQSRYRRSRRILERLFASESLLDHPIAFAEACSVMAGIERRAGEFDKASKWCLKSVDAANSIDNKQLLAEAYNKLGLTLWGKGELSEAARNFDKSLELGKHYNGMYAQAQTENNLGIIQWEEGNFIPAEAKLVRAMEIFRDIGDLRNEAYAGGNLASIYRIFGKFVMAEEMFRKADLIFEKFEDDHAHFYTVGNLGDLDLIMGNWAEARSRFSKAAAFAESVDDKELEAECEVRFGDLCFFCRNTNEAKSKYLKAIEMAKALGSTEYYIRGCIGLARLYILQKDKKNALGWIKEVSNNAKVTKAAIIQNEATFLEGELYRITNKSVEAIQCYRQVLEYAKTQKVFELILKSTVRLYEMEPDRRILTSKEIVKLANTFAENNGPTTWSQILQSGYFSFFTDTLNLIMKDHCTINLMVTSHNI